MTKKELSQLYHLNREIETDRRRLNKIKDAAYRPDTPNLSGMPGGGPFDNRLERYAAEIADLEAILSAKIIQCVHEKSRLERYIAGITDSHIRQIFTLRFVDGLTWIQVAFKMGGNNTADGVRMSCERYIRKTQEK